MAHTPGPWRLAPRPPRGQGPAVMAGEWVIATVTAHPETDADAALIASGPDLLEALEEINSFLCYITEENTDARNDVELLIWNGDRVRAAIAKARGES